jgi:hypothetical protein
MDPPDITEDGSIANTEIFLCVFFVIYSPIASINVDFPAMIKI